MLFNAYETLDETSIKTRLTIKEKKGKEVANVSEIAWRCENHGRPQLTVVKIVAQTSLFIHGSESNGQINSGTTIGLKVAGRAFSSIHARYTVYLWAMTGMCLLD